MSSLNTNAAAMTALQTLTATNKALATVQSRISTGYRVAEAKDNAAYWSIATTMRSDNGANSAVQDQLGLGTGKVDVAYTAVSDIIDTVNKIKEKLVAARGASVDDQQKIKSELTALQEHIKSAARNANYAGSNLLFGDAVTDTKIVAGYNRGATGAVTVETIDIAGADVQLFSATNYLAGKLSTVVSATLFAPAGTTPVSDTNIDAALGNIETALKDLATSAATLGAAKSRLELQKDFVSKLQDAIDRGVGQLVDADMEKESAKLSALQVQQQLGIQALSIANSNSQNILALFKN